MVCGPGGLAEPQTTVSALNLPDEPDTDAGGGFVAGAGGAGVDYDVLFRAKAGGYAHGDALLTSGVAKADAELDDVIGGVVIRIPME